MARPTRQGVDYFPLDIHLDDKFKFIQIKYGLEGFAVVVKLLQKIYSYGYWYRWEEDESLIFAHENNIEMEQLKSIIDESITRDIFNKEMYDKYRILTSSGIQKRYKEIVKRRKDVEIVAEYLLVDNVFGVSINIIPTECIHDDDIIPTECIHDDDISTQSKVKESKGNESKVDENIIILSDDELNFIKVLETIPKYPIDRKKDLEMYNTMKERYPKLDLLEAIEDWKQYKLDKPLEDKSNARSQINTSFKNYSNWGKCLIGGGTNGSTRNNVTEFKESNENTDIAARAGVQSF